MHGHQNIKSVPELSKACAVASSRLPIFHVGGLLAVTTNTSVAHLPFQKLL
jgi:hypothetical protein